ncbi:dihydroneopterin aldolase [Syntrophothermus lipocalidus]|uniref:7,8-dihydroneopterin aldolase n=1 Tax=Syntrophothermus lipocalidus (strain DSM 12680 / TGB-C1) TaxID=643648 RepID=D7CJ44_SYNLT|nr:dihydroneopterin aldolase [Syntrophothermus lipocalidus]ADI00933.1 dihydroneopterin aldolase [Syntrophothermus lipocalidus DSM 12680]
MMDRLMLVGMEFWGCHGVLPEEKREQQPFFVDAVLYLDTRPAAAADCLEATVDYAAVYETIRQAVEGTQVNLIETLAENVARSIIEEYSAEAVEITVKKPRAPMPGKLDYVAVCIYRRRSG